MSIFGGTEKPSEPYSCTFSAQGETIYDIIYYPSKYVEFTAIYVLLNKL
jgi:hypothetical protein